MSFKFQKDATKAGRENLIRGIIILIVFVALQIFVFSQPDFPIFLAFMAWLVGAIIIFVSLSHGISLLKSGGNWDIRIENGEITWNSPNEEVDKSFNLLLSEIEKLILRYRETPNPNGKAAPAKPHYIIATKSGTEFRLSPNSGVNLQLFVAELERQGIELATERVESSD